MSTSSTKLEFVKKWRHALAPYNLDTNSLASQLMYRHLLERLEPYGLTPFHYLVLCLGKKMVFLRLELPRSDSWEQPTGVVDRMEDRKLVYRERDSEDRRIVRSG